MKINFGCGEKKLPGYTNVDICGEPDVKWDLSQFPWPFEDNCADEVFSEHFLEHAVDFEKTLLEMRRILKPGGTLHFIVPHFRSPYFPWHLHLQQFSTATCLRLGERYPYLCQGRLLFKDIKVRADYAFLRPSLNWILRKLANISLGKWDYFGLPIDVLECWATKTDE